MRTISMLFLIILCFATGWGIGSLIWPHPEAPLTGQDAVRINPITKKPIVKTFSFPKSKPSCQEYYDGEGNVLPPKAIKALVRSQYVITTKEEDSLIRKYFK